VCVRVCVFVCVCVYIYACVHIYKYICMYVCIYVHTFFGIDLSLFMCVCVFMCVYLCVCVCLCVRLYAAFAAPGVEGGHYHLWYVCMYLNIRRHQHTHHLWCGHVTIFVCMCMYIELCRFSSREAKLLVECCKCVRQC